MKERECISFEDYWMSLAYLASLRSTDTTTKNGAVIVNEDGRIVGVGYNDYPARNDNHVKQFELPADTENAASVLNTKRLYVSYAESNAILNRNQICLKNCSLYSTHLPNNESFKLIAQSGIKRVFYLIHSEPNYDREMQESIRGSERIAKECGIELKKYELRKKLQTITFPEDSEPKMAITATVLNNDIPSELRFLGFNPVYATKRKNPFLNKDDYFMCIAMLTRRRSKDPDFQVGACIIEKTTDKIISCGYNGFPNKTNFTWAKPAQKTVDSKHMYVCHAELNAIVNSYNADISNCTLYVTLYPCNECAKLIINSQIKKVVYLSDEKHDKDEFKAAKVLFSKNNIETVQYKQKEMVIDFEFY